MGPFLFQRVPLRVQFWLREISEEYESDPSGIRWRGVQPRLRFSPWKRPPETRLEVGSNTNASGWSWRDTQPRQMPVQHSQVPWTGYKLQWN